MKFHHLLFNLPLVYCLLFTSNQFFGEEPELESEISQIKRTLEIMLPESIEIVSVSEADIDGYFEVNF